MAGLYSLQHLLILSSIKITKKCTITNLSFDMLEAVVAIRGHPLSLKSIPKVKRQIPLPSECIQAPILIQWTVFWSPRLRKHNRPIRKTLYKNRLLTLIACCTPATHATAKGGSQSARNLNLFKNHKSLIYKNILFKTDY